MTDAILTMVVCDDVYFLFSWRRTNLKECAQSAIEINLNINFKAQNVKIKTDTNPITDPSP